MMARMLQRIVCRNRVLSTAANVGLTGSSLRHTGLLRLRLQSLLGSTSFLPRSSALPWIAMLRFCNPSQVRAGASNVVIGWLNLIGMVASIPIIAGGLWLARSSSTCETSLQGPVLALGFLVLLVSLAGFGGACFGVSWALSVYLVAMVVLIAALLGIIVFGFAVTGGGGGVEVEGRSYREYRLEDYSRWLRRRVETNWRTARACILRSKACDEVVMWTPMDYLHRDLTPIQSGCCKPPTACKYEGGTATPAQDDDCYRWNNAVNVLCYECSSCKAGVLEQIRKEWHKLSIMNVVILLFLVAVYAIAFCAFRNTRRDELGRPFGLGPFSKPRSYRDSYWWR